MRWRINYTWRDDGQRWSSPLYCVNVRTGNGLWVRTILRAERDPVLHSYLRIILITSASQVMKLCADSTQPFSPYIS